jgi:xanthine dehydrogenase YagS FAD-binding subunit
LNIQYHEAKEIERAYEWFSEYWDKPFHPEYHRVETMEDAISLLKEHGNEAKIYAGGTDFVSLLKSGVCSPRVLINLKAIKKIKHVALNPENVSIGALTSIRDIAGAPLIERQYPILYEAANSIASPHIRNMGTVGGNLCQETRCWYFRRPPDTGISFQCRRKKVNSICYAASGENQYHAITGKNPCVSVCPSDLATVLTALDAHIKIRRHKGGRDISMADLYGSLGTNLGPTEIISAIQIPRLGPDVKQRFLKFRRRKTIDFAIVSVAAVIKFSAKRVVEDAKIVLGGVSYKPLRALKAEQTLIGERLTENVVKEASTAAVLDFQPLSRNAYKVQVAQALVRRAIKD